ncbi:MAG: extensin family protein [Deltaproteobacteria bacterium]|nr:extensin family protein [Deltaproteobacteria bacterium]
MTRRWWIAVLAFAAAAAIVWGAWPSPPPVSVPAVDAAVDSAAGGAVDAGVEAGALSLAVVERPLTEAEQRVELAFNPAWIGAPCRHDLDCPFAEGFCMLPEEGFPRGQCSRPCRKFCPDRAGDSFTTTFCMEDPSYIGRGTCAPLCDLRLSPTGCRPGYVCSTVQRLRENMTKLVCLPDLGTPPPPTECTRQLDRLAVRYTRPDLADALATGAGPDDLPPLRDLCQIDTPVLLASPLRGVEYRFERRPRPEPVLVACEMALALVQFSELLVQLGIAEVEHAGTYNCRGVAGTRSLSGHGNALAIDVVALRRAGGGRVSVEDHWSGGTAEQQRLLRQVVERSRDERIFTLILTPDSNQAHADHLHLEVK